MNEYTLLKLINEKDLLNKQISSFLKKKILVKQNIDVGEIQGHIQKSYHNLRFIAENFKLGFYDWVITGCYYACYHCALALILSKAYSSKNHLATLCILISEFYASELNEIDIQFLSDLLNYEDVLFYVESKNKRENASYSSKLSFKKADVEQLKIKTILFVNKIKNILDK